MQVKTVSISLKILTCVCFETQLIISTLQFNNNSFGIKNEMKKIVLFLLMVVGFSVVGNAQQEAQYTQYMFSRVLYNPGATGSRGSICATVFYRNQWLGLELDSPAPGVNPGSTPTSMMFSFESPVKFLHGGLGFSLASDKVGYHSNTTINIDYALRLFWGSGSLAAGFEVNLQNNTFDPSSLFGEDGLPGNYTDPVTNTSDPLAPSEQVSDMLFDLSTGLFYQVAGRYYLGVSLKNLLAAESEKLHWKNARTLYLMAGYDYVLPFNPSLRLRPSALIKSTSLSIHQVEATCLLDYQNMFWGGLSYRHNDAIAVLAGVNWQKLRVGISYDMTTNRLGTFKPGRSQGTAELYMKYCFRVIIPPNPPTGYRNTRYLL